MMLQLVCHCEHARVGGKIFSNHDSWPVLIVEISTSNSFQRSSPIIQVNSLFFENPLHITPKNARSLDPVLNSRLAREQLHLLVVFESHEGRSFLFLPDRGFSLPP